MFFIWGIKKGGEYLKIIYKANLKDNLLDFSERKMHTKQLFRKRNSY